MQDVITCANATVTEANILTLWRRGSFVIFLSGNDILTSEFWREIYKILCQTEKLRSPIGHLLGEIAAQSSPNKIIGIHTLPVSQKDFLREQFHDNYFLSLTRFTYKKPVTFYDMNIDLLTVNSALLLWSYLMISLAPLPTIGGERLMFLGLPSVCPFIVLPLTPTPRGAISM